jgi:peptidoglycan hydrolase CwlO-like protein
MQKIRDLMERLRMGQQQLEDLQKHVAERDLLVAKLEAERQAAEAAEAAKEKHLEESYVNRERLNQLELAAKAQVGGGYSPAVEPLCRRDGGRRIRHET